MKFPFQKHDANTQINRFCLREPLESVFLRDIVILEYNTKITGSEHNGRTIPWKTFLPTMLLLATLAAIYAGVSGLFGTSDTIPTDFVAWAMAVTVIATLAVSGGFIAWAVSELSLP